MKITKILAVAAPLAAASLLSGASWESKAEASCSSNHLTVPAQYTSGGVAYIGAFAMLTCTGNDVGEVWLYVDYSSQVTFPPTWYTAATIGHESSTYLGQPVGSPPGRTYGTYFGVACSALSRQHYRTRIYWNNWSTGQFGSQAWSGTSGLIC